MNRAPLTVVLILACTACAKKAAPPSVPDGKGYYPAQTGRFVVYEVDSTGYGEIPRDTIVARYLLKEKFTETFTDNTGGEALRLERYVKMYDAAIPYDSMVWKIRDVWMVNVTTSNVQVVEGNIRYTKLAFPVRERNSWDGNAYNQNGALMYTYEYTDRAETFRSSSFERVLKVKQKEERTLISFDEYYEKYAEGAGLAQRIATSIRSNSIVPGVPVEKRIESGFIYRQTLINYGTE
jgi:hypothetical protein